MRVGAYFDLRYARAGARTGVGKHAAHLVAHLAGAKEEGVELELLAASDQTPLDVEELRGLKRTALPYSEKWLRLLGSVASRPRLALAGRCDWLYCPQEILLHAPGVGTAVTVHGLTHLEPEGLKDQRWSVRLARFRLRWFLNQLRKSGAEVLAPSRYILDQLQERGFRPERMSVVPNGVEDSFLRLGQTPLRELAVPKVAASPQENYVLAVGGLNAWDGGDRVLALAREAAVTFPALRILIAGRWHQPDLLRAAATLPNITLLGYVPAEELAVLMRRARAVVHLPLLESFGIIALESLATCTPLVASRTGGMPEISGDAPWWVERTSVPAQIEALREVLAGGDSVLERCARGHRHAGGYTWAKAGAKLVACLRAKKRAAPGAN